MSGPPRTGGHLLLGIIQSADVLALHTHNPRYKTHNDRLATLIKLRRRDIFAALMSNCLVWHTGQSTDYTKLDIEPFSVPLSQFEFHYAGHLYHHAIDVKEARFGTVVDMYFEDFVNNHDHALKLLDLKLNVLKTHNQSVKKLTAKKEAGEPVGMVVATGVLAFKATVTPEEVTTTGGVTIVPPF